MLPVMYVCKPLSPMHPTGNTHLKSPHPRFKHPIVNGSKGAKPKNEPWDVCINREDASHLLRVVGCSRRIQDFVDSVLKAMPPWCGKEEVGSLCAPRSG